MKYSNITHAVFHGRPNRFIAEGNVFEQSEKYADMRELMEKGKDAVCVYALP